MGFDLVGSIMEYEAGEITNKGTLELFSHLVKTGQAWSLQGHYGRTATALIDAGWLDREGKILKEVPETCQYCGEPIYDKREVSGAKEADWATVCSLGEDFGCDKSPETTEEGVGDHKPILS